MENIFEKYGYYPEKEEMNRGLDAIAANIDNVAVPAVFRECLGLMDLTSLGVTDSVPKIRAFAERVNSFAVDFEGYPLPASVCVYPNFAAVVRKTLRCREVRVTAVAGGFPTSQSFPEVKLKEAEMAVLSGADEIDIVLAVHRFLGGDALGAADEIRSIRHGIDTAAARLGRKVTLKVILETGLLVTPEKIAEAAFLAMEAGADFIKTSTGKVEVNATPMAAFVMCGCIRAFQKKTGRKVGFKAAGGIATARDAASYYSIVSAVLGKEWLCRELFRFGVSRLANSLLSEIRQETVKYF